MHHAGQPPDISLRPQAGEAVEAGQDWQQSPANCALLGKMMCCLDTGQQQTQETSRGALSS